MNPPVKSDLVKEDFQLHALCRCGCRQNFANFYHPPSPFPFTPFLCFFFFFFSSYPQFSLQHKWQLFKIRARLKLAWLPFSSLLVTLVTLRKVSQRATWKALRWDNVITIRRVWTVQYRIILVTFGWKDQSPCSGLRQKGTIIIARFSKVTTKPLAAGAGS